MILIRFLFLMLALFFLLVMSLAAAIWLKIRFHVRNPFLHAAPPPPKDVNVIEGEYKVLEEKE